MHVTELKESARARWLANRLRTRIIYRGMTVVAVEQKVSRPVMPARRGCMLHRPAFEAKVQTKVEAQAEITSAKSCVARVMEKHQNKFGTPIPTRRSSRDMHCKLEDMRQERVSNDSVMSLL